MNDYVEVRINLTPCNSDITDVAAALLADAGFESFLPDENGLTAYIASGLYTPNHQQLLTQLPFQTTHTWTATTIEGRDWNHEWEKNYFQPIVVADQCVIHSSFHTDIPTLPYDILIDPKMAFGTGHHFTTRLMIQGILSLNLNGLNVIDMGTGTGILAILSSMRGANHITGIEIDEAAYVNAIENIKLNHRNNITLINGDASALASVREPAQLFLANINRNVITSDIAAYAATLAQGGHMLLSGFYTADAEIILQAAAPYSLELVSIDSQNDWACLHLIKK